MGLQIDPGKEPDPGTWSVKHVSFWMESITVRRGGGGGGGGIFFLTS